VTTYVSSAKRARLYKVEALADRFWAKVDKNGPVPAHRPQLGQCWLWRGTRDEKGYGQIREGGRGTPLLKAHRVAYEIANGPAPKGAMVLHRCDTPACVRSEPNGAGHLFPGTPKDNTADMIAKGRAKLRMAPSGERASGAKLTAAQVQEVKSLRAEGWTQTRLAARFGLSQQAISYLLAGRTWKDGAR
jgi:hypothetical protein